MHGQRLGTIDTAATGEAKEQRAPLAWKQHADALLQSSSSSAQLPRFPKGIGAVMAPSPIAVRLNATAALQRSMHVCGDLSARMLQADRSAVVHMRHAPLTLYLHQGLLPVHWFQTRP